MKIEDDDEIITTKKEKKKGKSTATVISVFIVMTIIVVIGIVYAMITVQGRKLTVSIDGKKVEFGSDTFIITDERKNLCINKRYSTISRV